jgi:hypothetical protein
MLVGETMTRQPFNRSGLLVLSGFLLLEYKKISVSSL